MPAFDGEREAAIADLRAQRDKLTAATRTMAAAEHTAASPDRAIEATVDAQGRLTGLAIRGTGYRNLAPTELADRIRSTVRAAQDAVAGAALAAVADLVPVGLRPVLAGTLDLDAMFAAAVEAGDEPLFGAQGGDRRG
jgi:YbaB/EbfC DNA-binding family